MATLSYGGVPLNVRMDRGLVPGIVRAGDKPRTYTATVELDSRDDYNDLLDLWSVVRWRRPLGKRAWTPRVEAGPGANTLVIPGTGTGAGSESTHADAYLVKIDAQGSIGHAGVFVAQLVFELP